MKNGGKKFRSVIYININSILKKEELSEKWKVSKNLLVNTKGKKIFHSN